VRLGSNIVLTKEAGRGPAIYRRRGGSLPQ
jgi:hypothetical protein